MVGVSVIIPVFKAESYIARCAESLLKQKLDSIEFVFIDDCSPDNSLEVLHNVIAKYPLRADQVKVYSMKENVGSALVRVRGLALVEGDYVIYCDSDDWVDEDMYRSMFEVACTMNADVVICDYYTTNGITHMRHQGMQESGETLVSEILTRRSPGSLCNKLIRRSLLLDSKIIPPSGDMGDDFVLSIQILTKAKVISYIPMPFYYYYHNPESVTTKQTELAINKRFDEATNNAEIIEAYLKSQNLIDKYSKELVCFKHFQRNTIAPLLSDPKYYQKWKTVFHEINYRVIFSPFISIRQRVKYCLTLLGVRKSL